MKLIFACDSFKGSLTSEEVGMAAAEGARRIEPEAELCVVPVADGGEGTVEALVKGLHGKYATCRVKGPLGAPVEATYGISGDGHTAIMEMAQASGLTLIADDQRNPLLTNTYGTGQMIADALQRGCDTILIGIGGSATNDGGMGLLNALGVGFLDAEGHQLTPGGAALEKIATIDISGMNPLARKAKFLVICDVDNPLVGPKGSAFVFGPQKGADEAMCERLDMGLRNYARAVEKATGRDVAEMPGAGAAGGLGACFAAFFDATLDKGIELVLKIIDFKGIIAGADLIITGEGRLDRQTVMGKTPYGVLKAGMRQHIPVVAIGGAVTEYRKLIEAGFKAIFSIVPGPCTLAEAMETANARRNVTNTVEQVVRLWSENR